MELIQSITKGVSVTLKDSMQEIMNAMRLAHQELQDAKQDKDERRIKLAHDNIFDIASIVVQKEKEEKR